MNNIFKVSDEKINSNRALYKLNTDLLQGLKEAVRNNQTYRAMEYLVHIVEVLDEQFTTDTTQPDTAEDSLAPSRKVEKHPPAQKPKPKEEAAESDK